jgi:uncharacterized protein GlcG (DUF336 family)
MKRRRVLAVPVTVLLAAAAHAAPDLLPTKVMSMELARDIAQKAVETCRAKGYQSAAVVVDRGGNPQAVLRDVYATKFNVEIAMRKANASILSGAPSSELRASRGDIRPELNHIDGIIIMDGGLPIRAGGALIGAVGVSGAPTGKLDEECSQKALDGVAERLEFAD